MLVTWENAMHAFILPITVHTQQQVTWYNNNEQNTQHNSKLAYNQIHPVQHQNQ